jgi:glycosyltransferase involved in cell wall biosynthesis
MSKTIALCLEYPLALRGGVSVLVENLLPEVARNYRVVLVSPDTAQDLARCGAGGVLKRHFHWDPAAVSRATSRRLADQLAKEGVDLAHFHLGGNYGWGNRFPGHCPVSHLARRGVKTCTTVHLVVDVLDGFCGPQKPLWFKLALLPVAWLGKMQVLWHVQAEIAVSRHDADKLRRWYWPLRRKIRVLYHSRIHESQQPPVAKREPLVLNVGHIAARKGQPILAEAFAKIAARHPEWKLCLVGHVAEESAAEHIRQIAAKGGLADRVTLTGARDDTFDFMARAGIYVQPSLSEALGLALQEALFAGCPSIGSRVGGIPELIDDGTTGLLVAPGNATELAQALDTLMSDPAMRDHYSRAATQTMIAKGMTQEQMVKRHLEMYESILDGA